ncbi:tRNA pseudouridine(55) synthase TruB [Hansschlegelia zhihuaiae]|uniref:tRNA pseudouridine synthase B n=1 Tax=Hansschlegelia zhihuaiae TaxID=405005 RepID=A0A4Q0MHV7_9HYPH|nr:tRNA pseudouridine(55) synthase TruB [Hansschlegelia zhihuaiae]RXF73108.1 tRNA pseudouridine(55) synthase TruB [Hansschlegelia zhihuaiae]
MSRRKKGLDISGWLILDKPVGVTSTQAVSKARWLYQAKKAGHAGTLDPLASGVLPIAFGEATKTVPFVMDGEKEYVFEVLWGVETDTDDAEGQPIATSDHRPSRDAILAALPAFRGQVTQIPPKFSALKIDGERAYDIARDGGDVMLEPRIVDVARLDLVDQPSPDRAVFEAECGKGTYVRAIARDLGRALGTRAHIVALRRTAVGTFTEEDAISLDELERLRADETGDKDIAQALLPVETALDDIPALAVNRAEAARLLNGQPVLLRGRDAPTFRGPVSVTTDGALIALGEIDRGELHPRRIFHLDRP